MPRVSVGDDARASPAGTLSEADEAAVKKIEAIYSVG